MVRKIKSILLFTLIITLFIITNLSGINLGTFAQLPLFIPQAPDTTGAYSDTWTMFGNIVDLYLNKAKITFIVSGNWSLNVDHGQTKNFSSNMFAVLTNGSKAHTHSISNFRQFGNTTANLDANNSGAIAGLADIGYNQNATYWRDVPTNMSINQGKVILIEPDIAQTSGHFGNEQKRAIPGIVVSGAVSRTITSTIKNP